MNNPQTLPQTVSVTVWDWPLRLFHWLLVTAFISAYVTGKLGGNWTDWHGWSGNLILGLLVFRLVWGLIGSAHARFRNFLPGFADLRAYQAGNWQGAGHNPFGALAVLALLGLLAALVITGLYANDDIGFQGPLTATVDKALSDRLSGWHVWLMNPLLALVLLHIVAIAFYQVIKKTNLLAAMIHGKKTLAAGLAHAGIGAVDQRLAGIAVLIALAVVWGVNHAG